jgi:hypothetical protein
MKRYLALLIATCLLCPALWADTVGPKYPSSGVNDASAGNVAWTNPGNAVSDDNSYAQATGQFALGQTTSKNLDLTDFGITSSDIPDGSTVDGVLLELGRKQSGSIGTVPKDLTVQMLVGGTASGDNKADTATVWGSTEAIASYGGAADTWNNNLSPSDVRADTFGFRIRATLVSGFSNATAQVDFARITIYFTPSGGGPQQHFLMMMGVGQ